MSRLKKVSNNVDPYINRKVEDIVVNQSFTKKNEDQSANFLLAKKVFALTPYIPTASSLYLFTEMLDNECIENLGEVNSSNKDQWIAIVKSFIENTNKTRLSKKNVEANNYLDMNKDLNVKVKHYNREKEFVDSFSLAKDLINSLPIVPRYELMSQLSQDIEKGSFDDISSVEDARENWEDWVNRTKSILKSRNIILSKKNYFKKENR